MARRSSGAGSRTTLSGSATPRSWRSGSASRRPTVPVLRVAEAAERLGVSVSTVRRRVQRGELQAVIQDGRMTGVILEAD